MVHLFEFQLYLVDGLAMELVDPGDQVCPWKHFEDFDERWPFD